ncbi:MAG: DUF1854 domain-containing protein [Planctomycetota bacterium]|nr:DUF1854 domain-containing protein [Planctomycetota bacterium]
MTDDRPNTDSGVCAVERIERNASGELVVTLAGRAEPYVGARVARCFPWSIPEAYVSVRSSEGKEIALLDSLEALDEASRRIAETELHGSVFQPRIRRVTAFRMEFGVAMVTAETDRGPVSFEIRQREDVRHLSPTRALLRDPDGNTYEVEDLDALDDYSRKHLQTYF